MSHGCFNHIIIFLKSFILRTYILYINCNNIRIRSCYFGHWSNVLKVNGFQLNQIVWSSLEYAGQAPIN